MEIKKFKDYEPINEEFIGGLMILIYSFIKINQTHGN